jgi:hypothetical protein
VGVLTLLLAAFTYVFGLGSLHIMTNGDEMIYAHITRVTAASGQWLPLASEIPEVVDTKPPFIFWQGILSTARGADWSLWALRWPSLVWTGLTAALVGVVAWRSCGGDRGKGLLAAGIYLAFLGTYRYGRPFLTNPPEIFWLFLAFTILLVFRPWSFDSRFLVPTLLGVFVGLAVFAKSFAILAPTGLALAAWHLAERGWDVRSFAVRSLPGLTWTATVALAIFGLWFLLDPDPGRIWNRFVIGENVAKLRHGAPSYLGSLLWGSKSVWALFAGWFSNAGLLAFPLLGTMIRGWQHRGEASDDERLLWLLCGATFLFYCIPTQRSGRYLLDAMPAVAVLMAIHWRRLLPTAFATTAVGAAAVVGVVAWLSGWLVVETASVGVSLPWWHWAVLAAGLSVPLTAVVRRAWLPKFAVPSVFLAYLAIASLMTAFDPPAGGFDAGTVEAARGKVVWAPEDFYASCERQRMLLPEATVRGYSIYEEGPRPEQTSAGELAIVLRGVDEPPPAGSIGSRLELGARHTAAEFLEMLAGRVGRHLFRREWLVPVVASLVGQDAGSSPPASVSEAVAIAVELSRAEGIAGQASLAAKADAIAGMPAACVLPCLAAFGDATPGGANWLRSGLDRAAERLGTSLAADSLAEYVADTKRPAKGRNLAYAWLAARDAARAESLLDGMLDDPSLDLRREAVEKLLAGAAKSDEAAMKECYRKALAVARDVDQVEKIAQWLTEHGEAVDLAAVLGFVRRWKVSDTFDNAGGAGFAKAYPAEEPAADTAGWKEVVSTDRLGAVDLNAAIAVKKGVLAYAVAEIDMPRPGPAEVRLGSKCGVKVWVNGTAVMAHEIYHASEAVDQYIATADFRAGTNTILVKCCQNEQTEAWAADWKFQLRICDRLGSPLGSQPGENRP